MTRKACIIFNPAAGQRNPEQDLEVIQNILSKSFELDIRFTTKELDADKIAEDAVKENFEVIIASGGDGTLSSVAHALIGTDIPFGIIPRGTANAFANALDIPSIVEEACQTIERGEIRKVDAARCNNQPMLLLVGIGFEAETVKAASRELKNRWGILAYLLSGIQKLSNYEMFEAEIETDDKIIRTSAAAITVANAAPPTSVLAQGSAGVVYDDGYLDVTIVAPKNWAGAIAASYHLLQTGLRGDATVREDIGYIRTKKVKITTNPPQKVVLDGEIIDAPEIEVQCIKGGLNVFVEMNPAERETEKLEGLPGLEIELKSD